MAEKNQREFYSIVKKLQETGLQNPFSGSLVLLQIEVKNDIRSGYFADKRKSERSV